jgi:hypothetical protein
VEGSIALLATPNLGFSLDVVIANGTFDFSFVESNCEEFCEFG